MAEPTAPAPSLAAYAGAHGLEHRFASLALPKATQLMRHGFMQEAPSVARGDLPGGLGGGWLALVDYAYETRGGIERSPFTLVLAEAAASSEYAIRVLCHDRGLDERERSNPDSGREVVDLDDRVVRLESDRFLERYAVSTDGDQDQVAVWQLFSPSLVAWLGDEAPAGFSFELQDGALCCFVPGWTAADAELDALCAGAARVFERVTAIDGPGHAARSDGETRDRTVERELAEHPFAEPPKSVKAAAKAFRHGLLLGDRAWGLGAEAFFREHARAAGFEPVPLASYRSTHLDTFLPGVPERAARGRVASGAEAFLVLTDDENYDEMGWSNLVVASRNPFADATLAASRPQGDAAERGAIRIGGDGRSLILSALDGGRRDRNAAELEAFLSEALGLVDGQR